MFSSYFPCPFSFSKFRKSKIVFVKKRVSRDTFFDIYKWTEYYWFINEQNIIDLFPGFFHFFSFKSSYYLGRVSRWHSGKEFTCQQRRCWVQFLGQEDPLEKEMATHSNILAWRIPWAEEPGRQQSMGVVKSWTWLSTHTPTHPHSYAHTHTHTNTPSPWEGSLLEMV